MAIPVILAETVAITELFILFSRRFDGLLRLINRSASILGGLYFTGIFVHLLLTAVIPLTQNDAWRGPADIIAVGAYLAGIVPLLGLALLDLGITGRSLDDEQRLKQHALWVAVFLVVAHVAMIFGMLDPNLLQTNATPSGHEMMHHAH